MTRFSKSDPATDLYCVQSGRVGIYLGDRLFDTVEGNGIFGQMSLIERGPRGADAIAETDVTLAAIPQKSFLFCVSETPDFSLKVIRALARWMRPEVLGPG